MFNILNLDSKIRSYFYALRKVWPIFLVSLILCGVGIFGVLRWHYEGRLSTNDERIKLFDERRSFDGARIADYQERLKLVPPDSTAYSTRTNAELQSETLEYVAELRELQDRIFQREAEAMEVAPDTSKMTEEEWEEWAIGYGQRHLARTRERGEEFVRLRVKGLVLREEMLSRLPGDIEIPHLDRTALETGILFNPDDLGYIADHLEALALLLPTRNRNTP